ncbi:MAG: class F sortase [Micromonosporaceae bacterium]
MLPLVVVLMLVGFFCVGVGLGQLIGLPSLPSLSSVGDNDRGSTEDRSPEGGSAAGLSPSIPTQLSIPSLGVRAKVIEVGRAADGSIAPPAADPAAAAGWYRLGPTPGELGTAVIVGHVDTASQPAVFHRLHELRTGKLIEVNREDRGVATFVVESVETFPKTSFPVDRVFDPTDRARLVLVTCGGTWLGGDIGYRDNVIVFATLA